MATSAFKSTSRKPTTSSSSITSTIKQPLMQPQPRKPKNSTQKAPPRRSRSVSAFSRTHLDTTAEFQNKRDNPLFWVDGSSHSEENFSKDSNFENPKFVGGGESRRGRSVCRNSGDGTKVSGGGSCGGRKGIGRSLSRVDTGRRRRSPSQARYGNSEGEREQENFRRKSNISSIANRYSPEKKGKLVRSASDLSEILKGRNTWSSQHPAFETSDDPAINLSCSRIPHWDAEISSSFSEAEEKTIQPVSEEKIIPMKDNDGTTGGILETVRSEVRRAISDMQNDIKNVMLGSNSDDFYSSIISDETPVLENPTVVELVEDFKEEFARELEECEERTRKLRAELAFEEHREIELNKILNDIVPEPKTPVAQKTRAVRKASFERKKMSRHLEEEALAYFDECVSISTFDESDFSSLEDLPSIMVTVDGPGGEKVGLPGVSSRASDPCSFESQRTPLEQSNEGSLPRSKLKSSVTKPQSISLEEDIRSQVKIFSKGSGRETSDSDIVRISHLNAKDYHCEVPMEKLLLDRVTFRSRIESGSMLICGGGVGFSVASFSSVLRHRWTGRFEAHLWDKSSWNNIQNKKGRQVYLGAYDSEVDAARTYDLAALKYWGPETTLNFPIENYTKEVEEMQNVSKEEYLASLRRRSSGFSRGVSKYRGVARHHHNGRWEARIGRVFGNKYLYLGTFSSQEEAAAAYDLAAIEYRGPNAVTNFDISNYIGRVKNLMPKGESQLPISNQAKAILPERQQKQEIKQQKEEEDQQDDPPVKQRNLAEVVQQEQDQQQMGIAPQLGQTKLVNSIDHHPPMLEMDGAEDERENPWNFCLDTGGYDPLLVPDIPFEEDGRFLDLFDQTGFEENIDMIFEGEGNLISLDDTFFDGTEVIGCQTSNELDKEIEKLPKVEVNSVSFSSSSPSSPSSITSLVSCQL